jgi:hypothetical protein
VKLVEALGFTTHDAGPRCLASGHEYTTKPESRRAAAKLQSGDFSNVMLRITPR